MSSKMNNKLLTFSIIFTLYIAIFPIRSLAVNVPASTVPTADFIQFNAQSIANVKQSLKTNTAAMHTQQAFNRLLKSADKALNMINPTVMDKTILPPTKNKHDYLSISRYWWPDPTSANGLPWIRKDGETNPSTQTDDVDRQRLGKTVKAIRTLSLAYYFSDNERYAQKAVSLIDTWFLETETQMNPHLTYAQSIPGKPKPRRSGILDGRVIPESILDAITMLSKSPSWNADLNQQITTWLTNYLNWLTKSKIGLAGAKQTNNHGSWYRFQVASLAWYLGEEKLLKKAIADAQNSLPEQFNAKGAQEHELARTRGFFYSCFNLQALSRVATIAEKNNLSLWGYTSPQGHNLKLAIDYLMPVANGGEWHHNSKKIELSQLAMILGDMLPYTDDPKYHRTLRKILTDIANKDKLSSHEKRVYYGFALLQPELM